MSSARLPSGGGRQRQRGGCHTQTHIHSNNSHGHDWSLCGGTDINTHYPCTQNTGNVICRRVEASHQYSEQNMSSEKLFVCLPTEHTCLTVHHTLHWLSFFLNANSQFKEHVKTPVPRKWKTSKRFQEEKKSMLKLCKDGFTLLSLKGHSGHHWHDASWLTCLIWHANGLKIVPSSRIRASITAQSHLHVTNPADAVFHHSLQRKHQHKLDNG